MYKLKENYNNVINHNCFKTMLSFPKDMQATYWYSIYNLLMLCDQRFVDYKMEPYCQGPYLGKNFYLKFKDLWSFDFEQSEKTLFQPRTPDVLDGIRVLGTVYEIYGPNEWNAPKTEIQKNRNWFRVKSMYLWLAACHKEVIDVDMNFVRQQMKELMKENKKDFFLVGRYVVGCIFDLLNWYETSEERWNYAVKKEIEYREVLVPKWIKEYMEETGQTQRDEKAEDLYNDLWSQAIGK